MATVAIGKIGSIEGNVNVVHADGTTGSLQQGAIVYADDAISTDENSQTRIEFIDGSSLNIGPEFTATLSKDVFDPALIQDSELVILDSSDRAVSPDSGHDTEGYGVRVGVVETTVGVVEAVDEDGAIRTLLAGDVLYATDILKVGSDGDVSIRLVDGSDLSLGPNSLARMDDVDPYGISQVAALTEPAEIEAAIIAGGDPSREAAAPAAGESAGNEGGVPVILTASDRQVTPDSNHDTHGFEHTFRIPEQDQLATPDRGVIISDLTAKISGGEATLFEANLADGTDPNAAALIWTGDFTISAPDGVGSLVIGDVTVIDAGGLTGTLTATTGLGNELNITGYDPATGVVSYSYTLLDNEDHPAAGNDSIFDDTAVVLTDTDGDTTEDVLSINVVDDVPEARDDTPDAVVEDDAAHTVASGNVVLDNDIPGADTPASFTAWDTAANAAAEAELATYGTLSLDPATGDYTFELDNSLAKVQALLGGQTETFELAYSMQDAEGDTDTATLTITIEGTNDGVTITDLTAKADGGEAMVSDANLADGTDPDAAALTRTGDFTISAPDGMDDLVIGGVTIISGGVFTAATVTTGLGNELDITDYDAATGVVSYSYTLLDNEDHPAAGDDSIFDDTTVVLTDADGDTASSVLSIEVVDDVPEAHNDTADAVIEDAVAVASGNVLDNDIPGADTPASFTAWDTAANAAAEADLATYGTLTLDPATGDYTFELDNSLAKVQALLGGQTETFELAYSMQDAEGDTDTAILTITIEGTDDGVTITDLTAKADGGEATVFDANLADGTDPDAAALTRTGDFTINAPDGVGSLVIGGVTVIDAGGLTGTLTATTGLGNSLIVTGYDAATGEVSYSYTLLENESHPLAGNDSIFDDTAVVLTDADGDMAASVLSIQVVDDVPEARNDNPNAVIEDDAAQMVVSGNVLDNDILGADTPASFTAWDTAANAAAEADLATYGTLTLDPATGDYNFELDNSLAKVQALLGGQTESFDLAYSMEDADGDTDTAILKITIEGTDDGVIITDLTAKADGGEATVFDANLAEGTDPDAAALTRTGDFTINAPDGVGSLVIGGVTVIDAGGLTGTLTATTGLGNSLTVTGYDAATGEVSYSYTLLDNESHPLAGNDSIFDDTAVVLTDTDGDTAASVLSIQVVDDVPEARNDNPNAVIEDDAAHKVASGNVLDNDISSADTPASFTAWDTAANAAVEADLATYGTLTLDPATGDYSFELDSSLAKVQALSAADTLSFDLAYSMEDADGDLDAAILKITIEGTDDGVIITDLTAKADGGEATVFDANLAEGTDPDAEALTRTGDFTINAPDGVGSLVIGGVTVIDAGGLTGTLTATTGLGNSLTVTGYDAATGEVSYSYTLLDNESHPLAGNDSIFDDTAVVLTDADGDTAASVLSIQVVDDVPEARNDNPNAVIEDDAAHKVASGNVLDNDISSADTSASFTAWDTAANAAAEADLATYGTLTLDPATGDYNFELDNSLAKVQALLGGQTESFDLAYSMEDADGDLDVAILKITIEGTDDGVIITDLTAKADGGEATVFDANLAEGTDPDAAALTRTGDFTINAPDGVGSLVIGGVTVIDAGGLTGTLTATTGLGNSLTVTGYDAATGEVSYSYTLLDNESHPLAGNDSIFDDTAVVLTDTDGDTAASVLSIQVVDDVPEARNDNPNAVIEDDAAHKVASGNVLDNDILGADTPASFTAWDTAANAAAEADLATYGTLTLDPATGDYSFELDSSLAKVQALSAADTLSFDLAYSMEDADGDLDAAILKITIEGTDDGVIITDLTAKADGGEATVFDANLAEGTDPDAAALTRTGDFTINAPDGVGSLVIGGVTVIDAGGLTGTLTATTGLGNSLTVTGYDAATGEVSYSYTLLDNESHPLAGNDSIFDDTNVVLTDADGDMAASVLSIQVVDDVPVAMINASSVSVTHDETLGDDSDADDVMPAPTSITAVYGTSDVIGGANSGTAAITTSGSVYGADGAGTTQVTLSNSSGDVINAVNSGLNVSGDTTAAGDIYLFTDSNGFITGHVGSAVDGYGGPTGQLVFVVALENDNSISVVQYEAIEDTSDGSSVAAHDHTESIANLIYATVTVTDGDGDTTTQTSADAITVSFEDDGPVAFTAMSAIVVNSGDALGGGLLNFLANTGEDGLGNVVFSGTNGTLLSGTVAGVASNITALGGESIELTGFGTTTLTATSTYTNTVIFTVTLDPANDTYTIDYDFPLDDGSGITFDDFSGVSGGQNQWVAFDGDSGDIDYDNNDSKDLLVTSEPGGTVNTNSTDIGSANNHIDPNQYIRLDLVTDVARQSNMDETDLGGYQYDSHYQADNFAFTLFQSNKDNVVKFTVFNFNDTATDQADLSGNSIALDIIDVSSIVVTDNLNNILVLGVDYDVFKDGDSVYISGLFGGNGAHPGDTVSFGVIAGTSFEALQIDNADGDTINDELTGTTVNLAGEDFSIGGFEFGTAEAGQEVDFSLDLTATDGDGDTTTGTLDILLSPDGNTATAPDSAGYALIGDSSSDILVGAGGDDILTGGRGDDIISGGAGADTFTWLAGESGTDVVNDFSTEEGDVLNIADLLVGEESLDHSIDELLAAALDSDYISIATGTDTTVTIFSDGEGSGTPGDDQVIQLNGYDTTSFANSADVINSLLDNGSLLTD